MRIIAWILYGVMLLLGVGTLSGGPADPPGAVRAAADLTANRLVRPGDLALAPGGHRYLRRDAAKGEVLGPEDFAALPDVAVPKGNLPLVLPVTAAVGSGLAIGGHTWLCPAVEGAGPLIVRALLCDEGAADCLAVLAMPADQAAAVEAALQTTPPANLSPTACE